MTNTHRERDIVSRVVEEGGESEGESPKKEATKLSLSLKCDVILRKFHYTLRVMCSDISLHVLI